MFDDLLRYAEMLEGAQKTLDELDERLGEAMLHNAEDECEKWLMDSPTSASTYFLEAAGEGHNATTWSREDIRERIQWYMIGQAAFSCALLLLILAYFPAKPLTPPSPSGFVQRADYLPGIKALATNRYLLLYFF